MPLSSEKVFPLSAAKSSVGTVIEMTLLLGLARRRLRSRRLIPLKNIRFILRPYSDRTTTVISRAAVWVTGVPLVPLRSLMACIPAKALGSRVT